MWGEPGPTQTSSGSRSVDAPGNPLATLPLGRQRPNRPPIRARRRDLKGLPQAVERLKVRNTVLQSRAGWGNAGGSRYRRGACVPERRATDAVAGGPRDLVVLIASRFGSGHWMPSVSWSSSPGNWIRGMLLFSSRPGPISSDPTFFFFSLSLDPLLSLPLLSIPPIPLTTPP